MPKSAKDFIDEVQKNPDLRNKIFQQSADMVHNLAKEQGFEFSNQELHDALHEKMNIAGPRSHETDASNCVVVIVAAAARR